MARAFLRFCSMLQFHGFCDNRDFDRWKCSGEFRIWIVQSAHPSHMVCEVSDSKSGSQGGFIPLDTTTLLIELGMWSRGAVWKFFWVLDSFKMSCFRLFGKKTSGLWCPQWKAKSSIGCRLENAEWKELEMKGKASSALSKFWCRPLLPVNNSVSLLAARLGSWAQSAFLRSNLLYFPAKRYQRLIHFWSISAASRNSDDVLIPTACIYCGFQRCDIYWCIKMSLLSIKMCFVWVCALKSVFSLFPQNQKASESYKVLNIYNSVHELNGK